ncbi:hypothetical protein N0V90_006211 [Kalmusia sp. IMI 367209]|nr:hypothetical protein N0V90_006211 [Kalmusia sp. IMI 367209]
MEIFPPSHTSPVGSSSSDVEHLTVLSLDLTNIPPIGVLYAHLKSSEEDRIKATLRRHGAQLMTADISKVGVFIGRVGTRTRAEFELRRRRFEISEVIEPKRAASPIKPDGIPLKRTKMSASATKPITVHDEGSTTEEEIDEESQTEDGDLSGKRETPAISPVLPDEGYNTTYSVFNNPYNDDMIWVVKVDWLDECLSAGHVVPLGDNLPTQNVLNRAKIDTIIPNVKQPYKSRRYNGNGSRRFDGKSFAPSAIQSNFVHHTTHLLQRTTSEYEGEDSDTPLPPDWVKNNIKYSCQRLTPASPPNEDFIDQLKQIRTARILINDEVGVRAYSSIIASIAAYPYKLTHPRELARLPGCDEKTTMLFVEWKNTGKIQAVEDYENDEAMKVLRSFYDIWGVGAKTARHFYYNKNWLELDDIIEFGWNELDRVQQIGLKYYDEFLEKIPRAEVEHIANVVRQHAVRLRDGRISVTLVGGYRRGKAACGDVDMIVSHPDLSATANLIQHIVESLEDAEWITHTLTMSLHNTHRNQVTLPFRTTKASGAGFDTLDKALVVWQDPSWPARDVDLAANPKAKNPNIHRRVDIIVAPWRTVGCAVMGWSGGTTFQRDLRRYAKYKKRWKFDSSGIRSRETGEVIQLEGPEGVDGTAEDAEKKVFEGLGLDFVPPEMRCTN